ncbi:MAG: hypothetical protein RLZZ244_1252 [Verrucomicrobiota bacterium]
MGGNALFPLDGGGRLGGDVVYDPVYAFDLVDDARGDLGEKVVGHPDPVGGHAVLTFDDAEGDGVLVGTFIPHDADGTDGEEDGEALPDLVVPVAGFHLGHDNGVGFAQDAEALCGDVPEDADGEAGSRERLAVNDFLWESELGSDLADFVLEEFAQGFDELELHVFGKSADVVMALDERGGVAGDGDAFNDVRVEGPLSEELVIRGVFGASAFFGEVGDGVFEDLDELAPDDSAFFFGVGDALEFLEEAGGGVCGFEPHFEIVAEELLDGLGFVGAQEAVVDEDAGELVADGAVDEGGGDAGVDAPAESEDDVVVADLLADAFADFLDEGAHGPVALERADFEDEVLEDFAAARGVDDLGVELEAVEAAGGVLDDGEGAVVGGGDGLEALGELGDFVAVGVPDFDGFPEALEEGAFAGDAEGAHAVLAAFGIFDFAAEVMPHELHSVADAEDGDAEFEDGGIGLGGVLGVDAGGAAGEDDALWGEAFDFLGGGVEGDDLGVDFALADASGDDLGVLGAEVEDEEAAVGGRGGRGRHDGARAVKRGR